ncbi:Tic22 family protein [Geitlerinema sp. PCC 9228]|uniref:Tic22 family protein n=1 Tax=Geitlerinema sp. PCC 9228 TaxID=111611 RepID=UPI0008F9AB71|nr:Tic22 family protein [Geitlerinema sp. PCC 9228]
MNFLAKWGAIASLVGATLIAPSLAGQMKGLALPQEQVMQKLSSVPVFVIADPSEGLVLQTITPENAQEGNTPDSVPVSWVFLNRGDAQEFIDRLQQEKPELGNKAQVVVMSLGQVYQMAQRNSQQEDTPVFELVPAAEEVDSALSILQENGQQVEEFRGVPLFVARGGEQQSLLAVQRNGEKFIPLFLSREDLQNQVDRMKQQQPDIASTIDVQVLRLERVINELENSDEEDLERLVLIPSRESRDLIRSLQQQNQNQGGPSLQQSP